MTSESWVILALIIVTALLLHYDYGSGDVIEVSEKWEELIVLPRKPPSRIAIGYLSVWICTLPLCLLMYQIECQSGLNRVGHEPTEGVRTGA